MQGAILLTSTVKHPTSPIPHQTSPGGSMAATYQSSYHGLLGHLTDLGKLDNRRQI